MVGSFTKVLAKMLSPPFQEQVLRLVRIILAAVGQRAAFLFVEKLATRIGPPAASGLLFLTNGHGPRLVRRLALPSVESDF
jgi:hypothetical protein